MLNRSDLNEYVNGNKLHFNTATLILIALYWETAYNYSLEKAEEMVREDVK